MADRLFWEKIRFFCLCTILSFERTGHKRQKRKKSTPLTAKLDIAEDMQSLKIKIDQLNYKMNNILDYISKNNSNVEAITAPPPKQKESSCLVM